MHNAREIVAVTRSIRDFRKKIEREENALYLLLYNISFLSAWGLEFLLLCLSFFSVHLYGCSEFLST